MNEVPRACPVDGTPIVEGFHFCPRCGREVRAPAGAPEDPADLFCLRVDWEREPYPAGVDSLARALLRLESRPGIAPEAVVIRSHLIMVLDVSGSMNVPDKYPLLRQALERMAMNLEDGLFLTVVIFSTRAQILCRATPAAQIRGKAASLLAAMDSSPIRFQSTCLAEGLDLAVDAARELQRTADDAVPRFFILTDGQLTDPEESFRWTAELERSRFEVHSFGLGEDFALDSMRCVMGACPGGTVKHIRRPQDILERFQRVVEVTASVIAADARCEIEFADGVIPGDFFSHRPAPRFWAASEFEPPRAPGFDFGALEAGRPYVWAIEGRLPDGVGPGFELGEIRLRYRRAGRNHARSWRIVVPVAADGHPGTTVGDVARVFASLEDLRDDRSEVQIAAYEARIEICKREGRDPLYLEALERVLVELRRGIRKREIDEAILRQADVTAATCVSRPHRYGE